MTKQGEKKTWVVRRYEKFDLDRLDDESLEGELNRLVGDGYTLYMIDHDRSRLIGYLRDEPDLFKLLGSSRKKEEKNDEEEDPLLNFKSNNPLTNPLLVSLISIIESHGAGDPHTEIRVTKLIDLAMKRGSLNHAYGAAEDLLKLLELHKARVTRMSDDKKPCDDSCSVNVVLGMAAAKLRAYLAKHPMS